MPAYNIRPASFRGVPFGVTDSNVEGGKKLQVHEFPQKDEAFVEELGRKSKKFSIEAFVVGSDYMVRRDSLIEALDAPGSGLLIHPYYGERTLYVDTFSIKETRDSGGMAVFSISFVESGSVSYPKEVQNSIAETEETATVLDGATAQAYESRIDTSSGSVTDSLTNSVRGAVTAMESAYMALMVRINQADKFTRDINNILTDITVFIRYPLKLAYKIINISKRAANSVQDIQAFMTYFNFNRDTQANFDSKDYSFQTKKTEKQANDKVLKELFCFATLSSLARIAVNIDYSTLSEAIQYKSMLITELEALMESTTDDSLYGAAYELKIAVSNAIPKKGSTLKDIRTLKINNSIPVVVLAHDLYGTTARESEIISHNGIRNPNMISGSTEIEVYS